MRGVFGGELEERTDESVEPVAPTLATALCKETPRGPLPELIAGVEFVLFDLNDEGAVSYGRKLPPSLSSLAAQRAAALEALSRAASAIAALHRIGACHGELGLGADMVRVFDGGGVVVLVPAGQLTPGALLRARLCGGGPPVVASFSAPEVVTGYEATPASDVYALSAIAHEIVTGFAPLGQIDFSETQGQPLAYLAAVVAGGLAANPNARPTAEQLAGALREAAAIAHGMESPGRAEPYRGAAPAQAPRPRAQSAAEGSARKQQASSMSGILTLLLAVGGLFVFTGAIWLAAVTWSAVGGAGHFMLLIALTSGILVAGRALWKSGYVGSGHAPVALGVELFWADGAYLLDISDKLNDTGGWSLLAAAMTALAFCLAGALDSSVFAVLAPLHYALFAGVFGVHLQTGSPTGPATYAFAISALAAGIAAVGQAWRRERLGFPFAALAALGALSSAIAGVVLIDSSDQRVFGTLWPYAVLGVAATLALVLRKQYRVFPTVTAGALLALVPTIEALLCGDLLFYLLAAVGVGFIVVVGAFQWPRLARDEGAQTAWVLVGLASVTTSPLVLFLVKCWDKDGLETLSSPKGIYLGLVMVIATALVGASYVFGRRTRKLTYRLLEGAGLSMIFGTFTIQSIVHYRDGFYPLAILALGAACLAVGATTKRATLVLFTSVALLLNLSIQYFAKLWDVLPASMLVLVFGLALLAGGVFYERHLKRLLPGLREWA
jgi:hypothetical protein